MLEASVQARVRLEIARRGWHAWRNNRGVALNPNGQPIRFGLANDSKKLGDHIKSHDLIGIKPTLITLEMVGSVFGKFSSWECKRDGWVFNPNDPHDMAQMRFAELVMLAGGDAQFITSPDQL